MSSGSVSSEEVIRECSQHLGWKREDFDRDKRAKGICSGHERENKGTGKKKRDKGNNNSEAP